MNFPVLNADRRVVVHRQGAERQPVIVVDDVFADPDAWRSAAEAGAYTRVGPHYPGIRSFVDRDWADAMRDELVPLLADTFGLDPVPQVLETYFSIVTTPPGQLAPIQRLPHFDGFEAERIAVLVYLSGADQGGTAFYRQRATGFESVDRTRFPAFEGALNEGIARHGLPEAGYIDGDTPIYERVATYEARPNRALIYRSQTLHCAAIPPGLPLSADPARGRLSINSFLFDGRRW